MTLNIANLKPPGPPPTGESGRWVRPMPVNDLRCPLCGSDTIWSLSAGNGAHATAHCDNGMSATRVPPFRSPPCEWAGTPIYRHGDGVFVCEPIATRKVGEARKPWEVT